MGKSEHRKAQNREYDANRRQVKPWRAWYKDRRWTYGRLAHLHTHPLCARCERHDRVTAATVVNHKQPHRGVRDLFFDVNNWESSCVLCHDVYTQREEVRGFTDDLDDDGWPTDPRHPANASTHPPIRSLPLSSSRTGDGFRAQRREIGGQGGSDIGISRAEGQKTAS